MKRAVQQAASAGGYPRGYFTALVRQHNWPPSFEPTMPALADSAARSGVNSRANGGFDSMPLNLPGAVAHLAASGKA